MKKKAEEERRTAQLSVMVKPSIYEELMATMAKQEKSKVLIVEKALLLYFKSSNKK